MENGSPDAKMMEAIQFAATLVCTYCLYSEATMYLTDPVINIHKIEKHRA